MTTTEEKTVPFEVLLVEDNPADVRLTQEAFRKSDRATRLHVASDGVEALAFLRREGKYGEALRPDLILLDLNLPLMDGREVLKHIKMDRSLRKIPTIVLTASELEDDVSICYNLEASCYLPKPKRLEAFDDLVLSVIAFWLTKVTLPRQKALKAG
jgi:two-component system, chemotaxis family, response regulator Rcp1